MSLKDSQTVKQLQSRKTKLEVEAKQLKKEMSLIQSKLSKCNNSISLIDKKIKDLKSKGLFITEHALLRYLEYTFDAVESVRSIFTETLGTGNLPNGK